MNSIFGCSVSASCSGTNYIIDVVGCFNTLDSSNRLRQWSPSETSGHG